MRLVKPQLDVGLVPSDPDATVAFYRDVMALRQLPSAELGGGLTQHRFAVGGHLLKINAYETPPARERGGIEQAVGMRLLAFLLDDYDALLARLDAHGKRHSALVSNRDAPYRVSFTKDPEGNVLELVGLKKPGGKALRTRLQVGLTVADVERSRAFYGQTLGLPEEPPMQVGGNVGTRYGFTWGESTIKFWCVPGERPVRTGSPADHSGIRLLTMLVEDLSEAEAELRDKGVPIVQERTEIPGVCSLIFFSDPDGNWIELVELNS
ncbi:MAG: VOC family protein [Myxococcales bacterium]|nr:VOC family protein [Myxococcales bacterium]